MRDKSIYIIAAVIVVGVIAIATGFRAVPNSENPWLRSWRFDIEPDRPGTPARRQSSIPAEGAERADVTIEQAVGELNVSAGGTALMDAEFDTNRSDWIPNVVYNVRGTSGVLTVVQPDSNAWGGPGNYRNTWNIELTPSLPIDLVVERGVGEATIDLNGLDVRTFSAELGVGDTTIDLTGARSEDMSVDIQGGVGHAGLTIPSTVGVRIYAEKGMGKITLPDGYTTSGGYWSNEAYNGTGPKIDIRVSQGVGEIDVEME